MFFMLTLLLGMIVASCSNHSETTTEAVDSVEVATEAVDTVSVDTLEVDTVAVDSVL